MFRSALRIPVAGAVAVSRRLPSLRAEAAAAARRQQPRRRPRRRRAQKKGGTLTVLANATSTTSTRGAAYYQFSYSSLHVPAALLVQAGRQGNLRRTWPTAAPEISDDGKTVTVKIKKGMKYSPPRQPEVKAKDVKYAIERGFNQTSPTATSAPTTATSGVSRRRARPTDISAS